MGKQPSFIRHNQESLGRLPGTGEAKQSITAKAIVTFSKQIFVFF
jgi:hypothetical protein